MLRQARCLNVLFVAVVVCSCGANSTDEPLTNTNNPLPKTVDQTQLGNQLQPEHPDTSLSVNEQNQFNNGTGLARSRGVTILADGSTVISRAIFYWLEQVDSYFEYTYEAGELIRTAYFTGPGADGTWFTADDFVQQYTGFPTTIPGVSAVKYNTAGTDNIWFTDDDRVMQYKADLTLADGTVLGLATYTTKGPDDTWFTADDTIAWFDSETRDAENNLRWVHYKSAGPDADWLTLADNDSGYFALQTRDANDILQRHTVMNGRGPDGALFTADDDIVYYHAYFYDANALLSQKVLYRGGPGADSLWFTADDIVHSCQSIERNANNVKVRTIGAQPGIDQTCFTADDAIWHYADVNYNLAGEIENVTAYYGKGLDDQWFTTDDIIVAQNQFIPLL